MLADTEDMFPNSRLLHVHKDQPTIAKRFEQPKTIHKIAPESLKAPVRIEALFTMHLVALLTQPRINRELGGATQSQRLNWLPIFPQERPGGRSTAEQTLRLQVFAPRPRL